MTTKMRLFVLFLLAGFISFSACTKDEDEPQVEQPQEYIANDASFAGFGSWPLAAQNQGPDPALGPAHQGNDSTVTRYIHFKDDQNRVNGKYPTGTIIVKESYNPGQSIHEVTAMVKRGNNFAPTGGDWEWFILAPDGKIAADNDGNPMRGADLMGGMCIGCHSAASGSDYSFTKE